MNIGSVKPICDHCRVIRRDGKVMVVHTGNSHCSRS